MIDQAHLDRRRDPQRLADPAKIVIRDQEGNRVPVGCQLFAVPVRAPGVTAEVGPHRQVHPLDMVGRHLGQVGAVRFGRDTRRPSCSSPHNRPRRRTLPEPRAHTPGNASVTTCGRFTTRPRTSATNALGALCIPLPDEVADNQSGVDIERQPQIGNPHTSAGIAVLDILLFFAHERPRFVQFQPRALEITHPGMVQPMARLAHPPVEPHDRVAVHAGQPRGCS